MQIPISVMKNVIISIAILYLILIQCTDDSLSYIQPGLEVMPETPSNVARPVLRTTLPASWDENWFASPAVFDLDNDGAQEIIAARHSVLYVWNSDGSKKWRAPVGENATSPNNHGSSRQYCSPVVGDLDGDGLGEIGIAYSNKAAVYDHAGMLQNGWPQAFPGSGGELRSLAAADLDNTGKCDILVVKTMEGPVSNVWDIEGKQKTGWPQVTDPNKNDYGGFNQNIGIADLDGNDQLDIVCSYDICHIGIFYPNGESFRAHSMFSGTYSCNVPMFHDINLAIQGWGGDLNDRDEFTDSPPAFADMDGDGLLEIVLFSDHERAGEYIIRGNSLWVLNPDMSRVDAFKTPMTTGEPLYTGYQDNIVQVAPSPCITTFGGTTPCIVVPSYDGTLLCVDANGTLRWLIQFDTPGGTFIGASEAVAGDLDGDGIAEIVFTTYSIAEDVSFLVIVNSLGQLLHRIRLNGRGGMAAPTLADVDGDNSIEIIISLKDTLDKGLGGVQIWNVSSAKKGILDWPTGRGNYLRTGRFNPQ